MDYLFKEKPIYIRYPILQISYILIWIPLGFIISSCLASGLITAAYYIFGTLFQIIFSFAFEMFAISGRWGAMAVGFFPFTVAAFDLIFLIAGLELINAFLNKKQCEEHYNE